jgi:hypothetical protein
VQIVLAATVWKYGCRWMPRVGNSQRWTRNGFPEHCCSRDQSHGHLLLLMAMVRVLLTMLAVGRKK